MILLLSFLRRNRLSLGVLTIVTITSWIALWHYARTSGRTVWSGGEGPIPPSELYSGIVYWFGAAGFFLIITWDLSRETRAFSSKVEYLFFSRKINNCSFVALPFFMLGSFIGKSSDRLDQAIGSYSFLIFAGILLRIFIKWGLEFIGEARAILTAKSGSERLGDKKKLLRHGAAWLGLVAATAFGWYLYKGTIAISEFYAPMSARHALMGLIEAEDRYFQQNGQYLRVRPNNEEDFRKLGWKKEAFKACEFAVAAEGDKYTAVTRCQYSDGTWTNIGFLKTSPGEHSGLAFPFGNCPAEGIDGSNRRLVNTVGPCQPHPRNGMSVVSGSMRRFAVTTLPSGARVTANGVEIGPSIKHHSSPSDAYGYVLWERPTPGPSKIRVEKDGFEPVEFNVDWDSFTYTAWVVLRPNGQAAR